MQTKITLIINNPADPAAFESQFPALADRAAALPDLVRLESAKVHPKNDGTPTPAHRTIDLYFDDYAAASRAVTTAEAGEFFGLLEAMGGTFIGLFSAVEDR